MSSSATSHSSVDAGQGRIGGWVFAYGSLMWHWPWPFRARAPARLVGYRRAPCLASVVYRGTPEAPGVGLGLLPGGECRGIAFGVDSVDWPSVRSAVDERELVTGVYDRLELPVQLLDSPEEAVLAVVYVVRAAHPQFLLEPPESELVRRIAQARGCNGDCFDYWRETLHAMQALDIDEPGLSRLVALADSARSLGDQVDPQRTPGTVP